VAIQYKTRAFVFKKSDRNEADQTFSVFTDEFGKVEIFAKAIRKINSKLRKDFNIFYFSDIEFIQGKNVKTIIDATRIKKFDEINLSAKKLKVANQIANILSEFIKGQEKDKHLFDLIEDCFDQLNDKSINIKNYQLAFQYFFWNFISLQGYKIEVDSCALCRKELNPCDLYFSGKTGGVVCKNCSTSGVEQNGKQKINSDVVKILRLIFKKDWQTISKLKIEMCLEKEIEDISKDAFYAFCPTHS